MVSFDSHHLLLDLIVCFIACKVGWKYARYLFSVIGKYGPCFVVPSAVSGRFLTRCVVDGLPVESIWPLRACHTKECFPFCETEVP